jgi:hypothetical protein
VAAILTYQLLQPTPKPRERLRLSRVFDQQQKWEQFNGKNRENKNPRSPNGKIENVAGSV